ncbi:MAG: high-potential iron-sulfur protein [Candidatus Eremiobacteraeota bacterium]|nr:high-potential iron-sulfur protein [Candidatus Eremiobacteraeota bacterium]MBC5803575.1 high-potential iron-sulfur protein [Candidatus Eremiobacteraeota bacterium]MBC5822766.1 high-potential iron-sulfur protein [Candidatus Eremiobacteraeota bacterium]
MKKHNYVSRADALGKLAMAPLAIGALAALRTGAAAANNKSAKSAVKYVDHPVSGKKCDACRFYIAAKHDPMKTRGGCQIVQGSISPNGYCVAWAKK